MPQHNFPRDTGNTRTGGRYDSRHQKARTLAAKQHHPTDPCTRCGQPLGPIGPWLHYDHTDDGTGYLGFAHSTCNIQAGARAGYVASRHTQRSRRTSRDW